MIINKNNIFQKFIILFFCFFSTSTILTQLIFNEIIAESLPLFFGFIFLLFILIKNFQFKDLLRNKFSLSCILIFFLYIFYITIHVSILKNNHNYYSLIFFFAYAPLALILINYKSSINLNFFFTTFSFFCLISVLFSFSQSIDLIESFLGSGNRARGLSRSSLNFATIMFLGVVCASQIRKNILKHILIILFIFGCILSKSRGPLIASLIYLIIINIHFLTNLEFFIKISLSIFACISFVLLVLFIGENIIYLKKFERLYDINSMLVADSLRLQSYFNFIKHFDFIGNGVGVTGPAAGRFNDFIYFESYFLNIFYEIGIPGMIILFIIFFSLFLSSSNRFFISFLFSSFFLAIIAQTFGNPSVNISTWIIFLLLNNSKLNINQ